MKNIKELESDIADMSAAVNNPNTPESLKALIRPNLAIAKKQLAELEEQISKKTGEKAGKSSPSSAKTTSKTGKKPGAGNKSPNTAVMKLAKEIRREGEKWPSAMKRAGDQLKNKKPVKAKPKAGKYTGIMTGEKARRKQYGLPVKPANIERDAHRAALPAGRREAASGNIYYENRPNRADKRQPPRKYPFL